MGAFCSTDDGEAVPMVEPMERIGVYFYMPNYFSLLFDSPTKIIKDAKVRPEA